MTGNRKSSPNRRKRRTTAEVLGSIVGAASEEFELNGYAGAKTAAIARRAGVSEPLIFTNFGSKAKLFQQSIFGPLNEQLMDFCASHLTDGKYHGDDFDEERRQYIRELQKFIKANSRKFTSLVMAQIYGADVQGVGNVAGLYEFFAQVSALAAENIRKPPLVDPDLVSRVSFATILSCILFKDWLFPDGLASDERIDDAIISQVIGGLQINDQ